VTVRSLRSADDGPGEAVRVSRGTWRYIPGDGVYCQTDSGWQLMTPLPHVHGRVIRRDGTGRQIATEALASATPDGPRVIIGHQALRDGSWANMLGLPLPDDPKVMQAASTAIRQIMHDPDTAEREAVPRVGDGGRIMAPDPECLPTGYLSCAAPIDRRLALGQWRAIADVVTGMPAAAAYVLGLSLYGPFLQAQRRQPFVCELFGDQGQGKTTMLRLAAGVWGDPFAEDSAVLLSWNDSSIGLGRHLGKLRILPAFVDESGMAGYTAGEWAKLIFEVTEGNQRLTAEQRGTGTRRSLPWRSVLVLSGNGQITAGLASGKYAGLARRLVSIPAPFTTTAGQAESLTGADSDPGLLGSCFGHLGAELLGRYAVADVARFDAVAAGLLGPLPEESTARTLARHLAAGVAGAAMADELLGTGGALAGVAATFAREYIAEHGGPPEHDADRLIARLSDSRGREAERWPTVAAYDQHLAQHSPGVARDVAGICDDDGRWVRVFPTVLTEMCAAAELDKTVALRELDKRGQLHRSPSRRKTGDGYLTKQRVGGRPQWVYQIAAAAFGDDGDEDQADAPGQPGPPDPADLWAAEQAATEAAAAAPASDQARPASPAIDRSRRTLDLISPPPADDARRRFLAGARERKVFAADAQYTALADAMAELDKGSEPQQLRILAALEGGKGSDGREHGGPFAPIRGKREPFWKPPQCPAAEAALPFTGWNFERDGYTGEAVVLDGNGAYVAATSSVVVAHGQLAHTGAVAELPASGLRPGYYLVTAYPWPEDGMPAPLGPAKPGAEVWVPAPVAGLLRDLAAEDRWPDSGALDSWTGDPCRLAEWAHLVRELRRYAVERYGRDSDQYAAVKVAFGQARGLMQGSWADGEAAPRRAWKCKTQRPDWPQHIQAQSAATLWRRADQCRKAAGPELAPLALRSVDELVLPAAALDVVTAATGRGARPPVRLDPDGIEFGTFKVKGTESWGK
jgi:hypothetical protein